MQLRRTIRSLVELSRILVWRDRKTCLELVDQALNRSKIVDDKTIHYIVKGMWGGIHHLFGPWRADHASGRRFCWCQTYWEEVLAESGRDWAAF